MFIGIFLLGLALLTIIQSIISATNVFYFSKDLDYILPLPLKPREILISKLNIILVTEYVICLLYTSFVELEPGIEGLVHLSQICERKITKPEEELRIGQKVNAKIIDMDLENKRIELSIRELENTSNEYKE